MSFLAEGIDNSCYQDSLDKLIDANKRIDRLYSIIEEKNRALNLAVKEMEKLNREHKVFKEHVKKELIGLTSELIAERMMQLYEDLARVTIQLEDLQISQNASKE